MLLNSAQPSPYAGAMRPPLSEPPDAGPSPLQQLAERRVTSQLHAYLTAALLPPMLAAYVAGFSGGDVPTDSRTPQAVVLAFLLGERDRDQDQNLSLD